MALDPKTHKFYLTTSDFDPPGPPTEKQPHPLLRAKPGNFWLLVYSRSEAPSVGGSALSQ
jgi:hypothetical protein